MTSDRNNIQSPTVQTALWSRKLQAFAVVALACFLLISLAWPLSVRSFVSQGQIDVDVIKTPTAVSSFKQLLADIVKRHTSVPAISRLATQTQAVISGRSLNELSVDEDFASRFNVRLLKGPQEGIFHLNVSYRGKGTKAENYMVNLLTTNIARDFLASPKAQLGTGKIVALASPPSQESQADHLIAQSDQLNEQAQMIFARLESNAHQGGGSGIEKTGSPFMNVAHSTVPRANTESEIAELKDTVGQLSGLLKESLSTNAGGNEVAFSVRSVSAQPTRPIGGAPKLPQILILSAISGFLASVVTLAYRPFEQRGFENIASVVHKLGVPVVATLGDASETGPQQNQQTPGSWANYIVHFAELALFAITIIAIGFCVVNPEIRSAFADNLFHGFTKIVWMFQN